MRRVMLTWAVVAWCLAAPPLLWAGWGICSDARGKAAARRGLVVGPPLGVMCLISGGLAMQARKEWTVSRLHGGLCFGCAVLTVAVPPVAVLLARSLAK